MSGSRLYVAVALAGATITVTSAGVLGEDGPRQPPSRPDFSGKWVLEGSVSDGPWSPFGSKFSAIQTRRALTLDVVTMMTFDDGGPATLTRAAAPEHRVIRFDAEERKNYPLPPVDVPPIGIRIYLPVSRVTRTGWEGEHLVITSHTVSRATTRGQTSEVFETEDVDQLAVSLVGKDRLSVERLHIADPDPWGADEYLSPQTSTTFYRREGTVSSPSTQSMEIPTVATLRQQAEKGDVVAEVSLAKRYSDGNGVPKDMVQAASWYRTAADQGNATAQEALALLYDRGMGVPMDAVQATSWYRKAAEQGRASAQLTLGLRYEMNKGVRQDFKQAAFWFRKAADQGNASAQYFLASQYTYSGPQHIGQDYAQAAFWYRKAAEQGMEAAMSGLGHAYERGEGIPVDRVEALKWYLLSGKMSPLGQRGSFFGDRLAKSLTAQQVAEAQKRADAWLAEFQKHARE